MLYICVHRFFVVQLLKLSKTNNFYAEKPIWKFFDDKKKREGNHATQDRNDDRNGTSDSDFAVACHGTGGTTPRSNAATSAKHAEQSGGGFLNVD
ncbi:hypothetical protein PT279_03540 [Bifidobacterium sp. ESL0784]|uniref:hypothetical protein n=1 Tax=Bifidobacterium sp. ESL0784 TaxID=2983231 RepID=UPI0023FA18A2|nr:hypothetical protein [Bifidobacterium sp. ESL0784]MDF7640664.1 hypothetical protein [Bifidobacterium sp. ESL0784]